MNKNETSRNLMAGFIGIILIALVFAATLARNKFTNKKTSEKKSTNSSLEKKSPQDNLSAPENITKKIISHEAVVIDIREKDSYSAEHILDSLNISKEDFQNSIPALDKSKIYVIMDDGNEVFARELAEYIFQKKLLEKIYYFPGGFPAWKANYSPTISFGDPLLLSDQAKITYIKSEELQKLIIEQKDNSLYILDVRRSDSFSGGHIKGSFNIFLEDLEKERKKIPLGKKIIVCDNDGLWAYMAAVRLFDMGIKNVLTLSDGLDAWKENKYELETGTTAQ
jgi:rhodanese-related sulfurtransferase